MALVGQWPPPVVALVGQWPPPVVALVGHCSGTGGTL